MVNWQQLLVEIQTGSPEPGAGTEAWLRELALQAEVLLVRSSDDTIAVSSTEIQSIIELLLQLFADSGGSHLNIHVFHRAARWADRVGLWEFAADLYSRTFDAAEIASDREMQVKALEELGEVHRRQGRFEDARLYQEKALRQSHDDQLPVFEAHALNNLGVIGVETGDLIEAEAYFKSALEIMDTVPHVLLESHLHNNLGVVHCIQGKPDLAYSVLCVALAKRKEMGNQKGYAETCHNLGMALMDLDRLSDAEEYLETALKTSRELGEISISANILLSRAELMLKMCLFEISLKCAQEALAIHRKLGDPLGVSDAMRISGSACLKLGKLNESRKLLLDAISIAEKYNHAQGVAQSCEFMAELENADGDNEKTEAYLQTAMAAYASLGNQEAVTRLKVRLNKR